MKQLFIFVNLVFLFSSPIFGAEKAEKIESIIAKAQEQSLAKLRVEASETLLKGLKDNSRDPKAVKILQKNLDQLSMLFYTEETQKNFHLGEAFYFSQDARALGHFQEALKLEPGHPAVLAAVARLKLQQIKCEEARQPLIEALAINPHFLDAQILQAQLQVCLKENIDAPIAIAAIEKREKLAGLRLWADFYESLESWAKLEAVATELSKVTPESPEVSYFLYKSRNEQKKRAREAGQKYINLCTKLSLEIRKSFKNEPLLCQKIEIVRTALAATPQQH